MIYWCAYLPYFAFAALAIGGMKYDNIFAIGIGIVWFWMYDPKPALQIIANRRIDHFNHCTFNTFKDDDK